MNISFFLAAFTSITWFAFSLNFIDFHSLLAANNASGLCQGIIVSLFPIAVIWGIFTSVKNYYAEKHIKNSLIYLMDQLKKNADNTNSLSCALIAAEKEVKSGFILQQFDTLVSDTNEILSDIIKRSNSISSAQIEHLWARTAGGERWLIAKTFIETNAFQTGFSEHLLRKAQKDGLLKGSILEFHARYKSLHQLLELHDTHKLFFNAIEFGALGKVYHILAPIAEALCTTPELPAEKNKKMPPVLERDFSSTEETEEIFPSFLTAPEKTAAPRRTNTNQVSSPKANINDGLKAIREELLSPVPLSAEEKPTPIISSFADTQTALRSIKKEPVLKAPKIEAPIPETKNKKLISLAELEEEINASPENNFDEYAYPFGAWLNDENHK